MSTLRIGARTGGRQAPRREALFRLRYGRIELAATVVAVLFGAAASYLVGHLGLTTSEATARTARLGTLWNGYDTSLVAFGFDRPPLLSALTLPFAIGERLRENGLAAALGTASASAISVIVATGLARRAGFSKPATWLFVCAFTFNPLLVYAGVFGLPEAVYASLVMVALSEFGMWLERQTVASVIGAGVALGVAFLVRYNVMVVVAAMAWAFWYVERNREREADQEAAQATVLAFLAPAVFTAGLWTLVSWFPQGDLFGYLRMASDLSALGADDLDVLARTQELRGDLSGVARWVGGWTLLLAPASVLAIAALCIEAAYERSKTHLAVAVVFAALALPEAVALLTGHGQAHVPHLSVMVVPAFVFVAMRERELTRGIAPAPYEGPRRRAQLGWTGGLALCSALSAGAFLFMPGSDRPAPDLVTTIETGVAPAAHSSDAIATAQFILDEAGPGDVLADVARHAEVMLLVGDLSYFQTDADRGEEAVLYEPFGTAEYVLVRRSLAGQGEGRIERAYDDLFAEGASSLSLAFEAGDYRLYAVTGPALP